MQRAAIATNAAPKIAYVNFHSSVFVSKNAVKKILKLDRKLLWVKLQPEADISWRIQFFLLSQF